MAKDVCHVQSMTHSYLLLLFLNPVLPTIVGWRWDWSIVTIVLHLFRSVHPYSNTKSPETPLSYWFSSFQEAKKRRFQISPCNFSNSLPLQGNWNVCSAGSVSTRMKTWTGSVWFPNCDGKLSKHQDIPSGFIKHGRLENSRTEWRFS